MKAFWVGLQGPVTALAVWTVQTPGTAPLVQVKRPLRSSELTRKGEAALTAKEIATPIKTQAIHRRVPDVSDRI